MNPSSWQQLLTASDRAHLGATAPAAPPDLSRCAVLSLEGPARQDDGAARTADRVRAAAAAAGHPVIDVPADRPAPSAFFGTTLLSRLLPTGAATLVVVGGTASDSVRATVVDGFSHGLRMVVVDAAVSDDSETAAAYSLHDVALRYGTVVGVEELLAAWGSPAPHGEPPPDHGHGHGHDHGHGHGHGHVVHQAADHHHGDDRPPELGLPAVLGRQLPAGATPVATSDYPVHGHVLRRAGQELIDAAADEMRAGFAPLAHVIALLTDETLEPQDDPRYREALRLTEGGAVLMGVGYHPASTAAAPREDAAPHHDPGPPPSVDAGPCPECGSTDHSVDAVVPVDATQGLDTGIVVVSCDVCGAAWDVPFRSEDVPPAR